MSKIRILPEQLANQIAAGEVIERPASVVKELIENSLDAGADAIEIEIEGGGTRLIRVIDNGEGMDEDDALLCFERHGTSKIRETEDLHCISSLGFRGEAIPSIASVSKMTITSRQHDAELGTTVFSQYGSIKKVHEAGAPAGTIFEISNLFGNTPARRKFLRTRRTELSHIDDTVRNYALSRPDVSFTLRIDGRDTIRLEGTDDLLQRFENLSGYSGALIVLDSGPSSVDGIRVTGLMIPPESSSPAAARLRLFVNGRAVKDRMLSHAVNEGLRSFLLKGRGPAGLIKVEINPENIDVNVHPAKNEIRFKDSRTVHQKVSDTVRDGMLEQQKKIRSEIFTSRAAEPVPGYSRDFAPAAAEYEAPTSYEPPPAKPQPQKIPLRSGGEDDLNPETKNQTPLSPLPEKDFQTIRDKTPGSAAPAGQVPVAVEELLVVGVFQDLYIFCRNGDNLVVIDQHAAHERLLYEDLSRQFRSGRLRSQNLLFPISLELSPFQSTILENYMDQFENMGFSARHFGGNTWVLGAVPALSGAGNSQELFYQVLEQFTEDKGAAEGGRIDMILATMACKAAVKSGDQLTEPEIRGLLEKMAAADLFSHCPHGRPVVKIFSSSDIKKWFYRT